MKSKEIGPIAITDSPCKQARTNPGVDPEISIFLYGKNRHIKGGNIFLAKVI
jgi:hypothetical protein